MYALLLPFGDRNVMHGVPTAFGSARRYLGLISATLDHWHESEVHFRAAVQRNDDLGARPAAAWSRYGWATMLLRRDWSADQDHARSLLHEVQLAGDERGLMHLTALARQALARLATPTTVLPRPAGLSPREVEVLRLIASGKSNQEIATILVISLNTVIRHVSNILGKIGAANHAEAAIFAMRHGLVEK